MARVGSVVKLAAVTAPAVAFDGGIETPSVGFQRADGTVLAEMAPNAGETALTTNNSSGVQTPSMEGLALAVGNGPLTNMSSGGTINSEEGIANAIVQPRHSDNAVRDSGCVRNSSFSRWSTV